MNGVLLLIPPLTQLNTPYPATAYLTGFLAGQHIDVRQGDLGLDMVLRVFSRDGLRRMFDAVAVGGFRLSPPLRRIVSARMAYEETIDAVIAFLQNRNHTLAYRIASRQYLPEGSRFDNLINLNDFFGSIGTHDKARFLCTLYLEDLGDLLQETVAPHFGFSRYAERIARTAVSFDPIAKGLAGPDDFMDGILMEETASYFREDIPLMVGLTVPFPGNLYGALKVGQWIKSNHPSTSVVLGGGYANTELRELSDPRVFDYVEYITLDDGEVPLLALYRHLKGNSSGLKRTYIRENGTVRLINSHVGAHFTHAQIPAPTYRGLRLNEYLSMYDVPNPMHRLWNDGRWNKLTIAHGCYWKKCSFCDISLDYISRFDQAPAKLLADKMEQLIAETGETGFHFVDEAAPPLAMRDLAMEIIRRGLQVSWWTNIRFEKTFTPDLCRLLAASGCIAVTGGLEVASPRLLEVMEKGITIEQVSRVCKGFRDAGILVHAYLMYGFPTETEQETIDSLEIVRQLFENNLLQSAFWHQFAMTVHSPVGLNPEKYGVVRTGPEFQGFANNDLYHEDPQGADHDKFSDGLKKALYNYMHGKGFDLRLPDFFDFLVPHTEVPKKLISKYINRYQEENFAAHQYRIFWYRMTMKLLPVSANRQQVIFSSPLKEHKILMPAAVAAFIAQHESRLAIDTTEPLDASWFVGRICALLSVSVHDLGREEWWRIFRTGVVMILRF